MLEIDEPGGNASKVWKVVWGKNLSLNDGEVDFNLIEPTGVDRSMNQDEAGVLGLETTDGRKPAMDRTIVNNPEDAARLIIWWAGHHMVDEGIKMHDASSWHATAKYSSVVDIKRGEISPGAAALIFMFDSHAGPGLTGFGRVLANPRLYAGLLVSGDHEFIGFQGLILPLALIEIENAASLGSEVGVARKYPASMLPRTNGVLVKPAPESAPANCRDEAGPANLCHQIRGAPSGQRESEFSGKFTRQRLNLDDEFWGKKSGVVPDEAVRPSQKAVPRRSVFSTSRQLLGGCPAGRRLRHCSDPQRREESFSLARPENTATYISKPASEAHGVRLATDRFDTDYFLASHTSDREHNAKATAKTQLKIR